MSSARLQSGAQLDDGVLRVGGRRRDTFCSGMMTEMESRTTMVGGDDDDDDDDSYL